IDTLTKCYTGKISIITNHGKNRFVDQYKLRNSFFPIRSSSYIKFFTDDYLKAFQIEKYDNKVVKLDAVNRLITLDNSTTIPFDKSLIGVGGHRKMMRENESNIFNLYSLEDHNRIHNVIIKPEVKNIIVMSDLLEGFDIVTSIRKYLNAIGKTDTNVILLCEK